MHSFRLLCKLLHGGHIGPNWKIVSLAATTGVVRLFAPGFIDSTQARAEKSLSPYMHLSYLNAELYTFMQIAAWQPYWIEL